MAADPAVAPEHPLDANPLEPASGAAAQDRCTDVAVTFTSSAGTSGSDTTPPFRFLSNPSPLEVGEVTVTAVAHDQNGLASAAAAVTFGQLGTLVLPSGI